MIVVCCLGSTTVLGSPVESMQLTILHANDFHGADYSALAREATLIKQIRSEVPHLLYLEAGDTFARGPYHRKFYGELEFAVFNALHCDAMTLGNNEFKATDQKATTYEYLNARIKQATFPVLCANIKDEQGAYLADVLPYTVKEMSGMKIGIIGVTTNRVADYSQLDGYTVENPIKTVQTLFPKVAAECDGVLALTHIGFGIDQLLAARVPKLWAIIGGDSHTALQTPYHDKNVPIVQAGSDGHYLGRLDLTFEKKDGVWVLIGFKGSLIPVTPIIPEDPEVRALIDRFINTSNPKAA